MRTRLSAVDAFFVAYHNACDALMHLGAEFVFKAELTEQVLLTALDHTAKLWPEFYARVEVHRRWVCWSSPQWSARDVLVVASDEEACAHHRNHPIDPFHTPAVRCVWYARPDGHHHVAFYLHHALADGELFFCMARCLVTSLRALLSSDARMPELTDFQPTLMPEGKNSLVDRARRLPAQLQYKRWMDQQHQNPTFQSCVLMSNEPGPLQLYRRRLPDTITSHLRQLASSESLPTSWLVMAGWFKTLAWWNAQHHAPSSPLSMEVPVSLRSKRVGLRLGNHVSQVVLVADPHQSLSALARQLKQSFSKLVKRGEHRAVYDLAQPGQSLPWTAFEKVATGPEADGFATGTYVWLSRPEDWLMQSSEQFEVMDYRVMTPACMAIGSSICVLSWPDHIDVCLTARQTAFDDDAVAGQLNYLATALKV